MRGKGSGMTTTVGRVLPHVDFMVVTPEIAASWLAEKNIGNRRISQSTVTRYATDMSMGFWKERTGEPIIFDTRGRLQQGQHRLAALIQAHVSLELMVVFNADPDDFNVLDQGKKRSAGDVLQMHGMPNATNAAAICRMTLLLMHHAGDYWAGVKDVTQQRIVAWASEHKPMAEWAAQIARNARSLALIPESQYGAVALFVRLHSSDMNDWDEFHERVTSGEMLKEGDPEFALRRWAMKRPPVSGSASAQGNTAIVVKAWNAFQTDKQVKTLSWKRHEMPMPQPLPSH